MCGWNLTCLMQLFSWFSVTREINLKQMEVKWRMQANVKGYIFLPGSFYSKLLEDFIWNMDSSKRVIWHWEKSCITYIADVWVSFICLNLNFMFIWWVFPETVQWKKPFLFPHKVVLWYWLYSSCFGCSWFIFVPPSAHVKDGFLFAKKLHC